MGLAVGWGQLKLELVLALASLDLSPLVLRASCYAIALLITYACYRTTELAVWRLETGTWRRDERDTV